ncbi:zinc-binding dehydrogenase [Actinoplanes sp. NPDC051411]|uniref:alcohol dehydrogenase catalytic domain-containing protein n=1 Tax=Actinoplanes sp. NPDC051411 TaxID=3155522 RepID=UPI0034278A35
MSLAVQFSEYGDSDVLRVVDVEPPTAGPGQVRLAVRAAGVNPVDWKTMKGEMREQLSVRFPAGLGYDVAGVVDQVGPGVTGLKVGDEVLGMAPPSFGQFVVADPAALVAKPAALPWEMAGGLAGAGGAAWIGLELLAVAFREATTAGIQMHVGGSGPNLGRALRDLLPLIEQGRLRVPVSRTYPLREVAAALDDSSAGHVRGKIVLLPN